MSKFIYEVSRSVQFQSQCRNKLNGDQFSYKNRKQENSFFATVNSWAALCKRSWEKIGSSSRGSGLQCSLWAGQSSHWLIPAGCGKRRQPLCSAEAAAAPPAASNACLVSWLCTASCLWLCWPPLTLEPSLLLLAVQRGNLGIAVLRTLFPVRERNHRHSMNVCAESAPFRLHRFH